MQMTADRTDARPSPPPARPIADVVPLRPPSPADGDALAAGLVAVRAEALRIAVRRLRGDRDAAEEVVADVLAKLWQRGLRTGEVFGAGYVIQCVVNEITSRWRRSVRTEQLVEHLGAGIASSPDIGEVVAGRVDLDAGIAQLPPRWQAIVKHRYLEGMSHHEVADLLELAPGSVSSGLARALSRLRRDLAS